MLGYERIPEKWKAGIPSLADTKFEFTQYSFNGIVSSTLARAEKIIVAAGGDGRPRVEVVIPVQSPKAPPLEQWDPGVPVARIEPDQAAWLEGRPGRARGGDLRDDEACRWGGRRGDARLRGVLRHPR